jgi:ABC-type multidrug transport system ATPase subunit
MRQQAPSGGRCLVNGQNIHELNSSTMLGFGFCPQANALFEHLTVMEMLSFYATIRGIPSTDVESYVKKWLIGAQLQSYAQTRCGHLSGGNKRKVSLAVAILGNPSLTVLDEPSAGVDPAARKKLHRIINGVKAKGTTVVLTTHHMGEAAKLGDRIGIMVQGRLACLGTPLQLLDKYSQGYMCSISMQNTCSVEDEVLPLLRRLCPAFKLTQHPHDTVPAT